jgi:tetratricopeptide (TPR) repeat protein
MRKILVIAAVLLSVTPAHADVRRDQAKQQVVAADIDYRLGRFRDALARYTRAYELYPVAGLLFNIGQCHKNLKDHDKAIFFFEGYLRDAPTAANRALVEDLIREARTELDKSGVPPDGPSPTPSPPIAPSPIAPSPIAPSPPAASPSLLVSTPPPSRPREAPPRVDEADHPSLVLPGALIGGGLAVSAGGAVFYYYGQKRGPGEKYVYDDTRWLGGTMMVLGGASIVAGTILLVRHRSAPVATLTPGGAYLGWAGEL